jgi:O-antigen/teichoic acid export membrane protein
VLWVVTARRALGVGPLWHGAFRADTVPTLVRYGLPNQAARICFVGALQYERVLVGVMLGAAVAGKFGVGSVLAGGLAMLLSPALLPLVSALTSVATREGEEAASAAFYRVLRPYALLTAGAFGALAACASPLVLAWVGPGYDSSARAAAILAVGFCVWQTTGVGFLAMLALGRPGLQGRAGLIAAATYLALAPLLLGSLGAEAAGIGTSAGLVIGAAAFWLAVRRDGRLPRRAPAVAAVPIAVAAALAVPALLVNLALVDDLGRASAAAVAVGEALVFALAYVALLTGAGFVKPADLRRLVSRSSEGPHPPPQSPAEPREASLVGVDGEGHL